jgi:SAM-dependent methyltransferase
LSYADGAEQRLLELLRATDDRSSRSDELAAHIVDWPSRYHLSRLRSNLFRPLTISPGMRVLEIGCGTGVNLRYLAECGAEVVGVEGSPSRAQCARERCRGLDGVTVLAGDVFSIPDLGEFDLVLLIGVLEYSAADSGGGRGPVALLELAESFLKPDGSLVLAIENQLGLKYLLGYREDHHALPWVGLDDYRTTDGARTWSRLVLSQMLSAAGLGCQRWMYPFPDYKLPTFVASDELFASDEGRELLRRFLLQPVIDHSGQPALVADPGAVFGVALDAGVGRDVSNSFLIVASRSDAQGVVGDAAAWVFSSERVSRFLTDRVVRCDGDGFVVEPAGTATSSEVGDDWLVNQGHGSQPVITDAPLLVAEAVDAWATSDDSRLSRIWSVYDAFVSATFPHVDEQVPAGAAIDCTLSNLVGIDDPVFVDQEWVLGVPVARSLVLTRALFDLSLRIVRAGLARPVSATVLDTMGSVAEIVGVDINDERLAEFGEFESRFQSVVTGREAVEPAEFLQVLSLNVRDLLNPVVLTELQSYTRDLERHTAGLQQHATGLEQLRTNLEQHIAGLEQHAAGLEQHTAGLEQLAETQQAEIARLHSLIASVERDRDASRHRADLAESDVSAVRNSVSFKIGNAIIRPFSIVKSILRRGSAQ